MAGIKLLRCLMILPGIYWLSSCASTEELFAQYDDNFCPVVTNIVVQEKEVIRDRVVVQEIPASAQTMPWEPAIYFDSNKADLSAVARQTLSENLEFLKKFGRYRVSIRGFTDAHSTSDYNHKLSFKRIAAVRNYFADAGITTDRIISRAHGESLAMGRESSPVADNINRRVEMILLDPVGRPLARHHKLVIGPAD